MEVMLNVDGPTKKLQLEVPGRYVTVVVEFAAPDSVVGTGTACYILESVLVNTILSSSTSSQKWSTSPE
jgi:hypothetical protein